MIGTHKYTVSLDTKDLAQMATDKKLVLNVEHDDVVEISVSGRQFEEVLERGEFEQGKLVEWDGLDKIPR